MDNSLKDKVLEATDIVEVVGERVTLTRRGKDFVGLCPFHPDHKPSLAVSPSKQIFKCWSCGAGGDAIRFVQLRDRVDFREALVTLARRAGIELRSSPADRQSAELREQLQAAVFWARQHFQRNLQSAPGGQHAVEYARQRGLTPQTIERYGLGLAPDAWDDLLNAARRTGLRLEVLQQAGLIATNESGKTYDRFRNRLIFPIADALGRPVAFGGRTLGDDPAKYLNSPETVLFSKSRVLYGLDLARSSIEERKAVIVVEGYLDAVLLHQYGFDHAVATLGTALTDAHVKLLGPLATSIYLCFDNDAAGVRAADRAVEIALRTQTDVRVVILDGGKDPADLLVASGAPGFEACLSRAVDALEFKWSQALNAFGAAGQRSRRAAVEEFLRFVAAVTVSGGIDPLQQNLLLNRLGELLGVPREAAFELLAVARRTVRRHPEGEPAGGGVSTYETSLRGLPAGLVTATETVFGLMLNDPGCWRWVDDTVARAAGLSETWQRLYTVLLAVHHDVGDYSVGAVMERCEDSAACELVGRARARVSGGSAAEEEFAAARQRLSYELDVLHMADLRQNLARTQTDERGFRALLELSRGKHTGLAPENAWNTTTAS
jgi:DNA primase